MTKHEFITKLNGKLFLLKENERRDIIDEYIGHIDLKMQDGKSESDAIKDFGDVDELADEILQAYHIDNSKVKTKTLDTYIKQMVGYINKTTERLLSFSSREIARILVELVMIVIVIAILRVPFEMVSGIFTRAFWILPRFLANPLCAIVDFVFLLASLALSFLILYNFINKRILNFTPNFTHQSVKRNATAQQKREEPRANTQEVMQEETTQETAYQPKAEEFHNPYEVNIEPENMAFDLNQPVQNVKNSAGDFVINLIVIILKVFVFLCVWLPSAFLTIAGIVCTVLASVVYFTSGMGFIGICLAGFGCCIIGISFTAWLTQVIMGGKKNA